MAKKLYVGVNNVARKVRKAYVGAGGVAHKIRKAYVGVGGVARPCYTSEGIEYYGVTPTPLSAAVSPAINGIVAASNPSYALFMLRDIMTFDAYNSSLVHSQAIIANNIRSIYSSLGPYAVFGAGTLLEAYDVSLTRRIMPTLNYPRNDAGFTVLGSMLLIGGGYTSYTNSTYTYTDTVEVYDTSLAKVYSTATLSYAKSGITAAAVGSYALFCYGQTGSMIFPHTVDTFNTSLTRGTCADTTDIGSLRGAGVSAAAYAMFRSSSASSRMIDSYNASLVKNTSAQLLYARRVISTTMLGMLALFCGGNSLDTTSYDNTVDCFTEDLSAILVPNMSVYHSSGAAVTIGDYALIGGGALPAYNSYTDVVDVYIGG